MESSYAPGVWSANIRTAASAMGCVGNAVAAPPVSYDYRSKDGYGLLIFNSTFEAFSVTLAIMYGRTAISSLGPEEEMSTYQSVPNGERTL